MNDDFFGVNENEGKEEKKNLQRTPAPVEYDGNGRKNKRKINWWKLTTSLVLAAAVFFCGYFVCWASLDGELRTLLSIKKKIQEDYYKEVSDEEFYAAVFGGINEDLLDSYSEYMTREQFAAAVSELDGNRSGIGVVFYAGGENALRIVRVCGNSPAEQAGLVAGEKVVGCGVTQMELTPCATFEQLSDFLAKRGTGEKFFLEVQSAEGKRTVEISKEEYVENYVFYRTKEKAYAFNGESATNMIEQGTPLEALDKDTAYIRLVQFTGNAANEFDQAMAQFKEDGKKNLVLDLRENGGGYLDIMQSIASYFCKDATEKKPVVAVADYGERRTAYRAYGNVYSKYFGEDSRICILADSGSASASECLIGCMVDYGAVSYSDICLAERGGVAKTFGKGIMQETFIVNLLEQDALKLTTAEIRWPVSNWSIHGRGVLPEDGTLTVTENVDFEAETVAAITKLFS